MHCCRDLNNLGMSVGRRLRCDTAQVPRTTVSPRVCVLRHPRIHVRVIRHSMVARIVCAVEESHVQSHSNDEATRRDQRESLGTTGTAGPRDGQPVALAAPTPDQDASVLWRRILQLQEEAIAVPVKVHGVNRGGLLVKYGHYKGFLPKSQLARHIDPEDLEVLVGRELSARFLQADQDRERCVFSSRPEGCGKCDVGHFQVGHVVEGVVTGLARYGAFIDLGGGNMGLLHVSQVSRAYVRSIHSVLRTGDRVKVMVHRIDEERQRLLLSTKQLEVKAGDMLRRPQWVYCRAEELAEAWRKRKGEREEAA